MRAILFFLLAAVLSPLASGKITLVGSDLLGPELNLALQNYANRNELALSIAFAGSRDGLARLKSGSADIALIVLPPDETPPAAPWHSVALAYHAVVVLVHADLPLTQITLGQLSAIFGSSAASSYTRWGELGISGAWSPLAITPQAMAPTTGLTLELFRHGALHDGALKSVVIQHETEAALFAKMGADRTGIALTPSPPPAAQNLKPLLAALADPAVAFDTSPQNLQTGDYPLRLRLRLWFVVRRDAVHPQLDFLRYMLGDEIALALERARLVPLPREARRQLSFKLEQL